MYGNIDFYVYFNSYKNSFKESCHYNAISRTYLFYWNELTQITALTKSVHKSPVKMLKNLFLWSTPKNFILEMGNSSKILK